MDSNFEHVENGYICILDILGIKGIWKKEDPKDTIKRFCKFKYLITGYRKAFMDCEINFNVSMFSDTIIISMKKNTEKAIQERLTSPSEMDAKYLEMLREFHGLDNNNESDKLKIIQTIIEMDLYNFISYINFVYISALKCGFFVRGCVTNNSFYVSGQFIIGKAIDDAAQNYEKSNWAGVHCENCLNDDIAKALASECITHSHLYLVKYFVPYKGYKLEKYALNWPFALLKNKAEYAIDEPAKFVKEVVDFSFKCADVEQEENKAKIIEKYQNTCDFYDFCVKHRIDMHLR